MMCTALFYCAYYMCNARIYKRAVDYYEEPLQMRPLRLQTVLLFQTHKRESLTQAKFSELLMMDTRSYASPEHVKSLCCALTFIIPLCFLQGYRCACA